MSDLVTDWPEFDRLLNGPGRARLHLLVTGHPIPSLDTLVRCEPGTQVAHLDASSGQILLQPGSPLPSPDRVAAVVLGGLDAYPTRSLSDLTGDLEALARFVQAPVVAVTTMLRAVRPGSSVYITPATLLGTGGTTSLAEVQARTLGRARRRTPARRAGELEAARR